MTCVSTSAFSLCVNGVSHGYFKGGRCLRQGDPMSPYLFTLFMEIFNLIMFKKIEESQSFKYHFGCKEIKLTNLCFADDILVVCNGDKDSLKVINSALNDFSLVSGLFPNLSKSTIFFGSVNERERSDLLSVLPFWCGKLPMKYLSVHLLEKRLGIKDCQSLVDRVASKVNCWRNINLSYAGRLQLIASVLASMHIYWASVYLLSYGAIREIKKLLKRFLRNAGDFAQGVSDPRAQLLSDCKCGASRRQIHNYDASIKVNATVYEMIVKGNWIWPTKCNVKYPILRNIQCPTIVENIEDKLDRDYKSIDEVIKYLEDHACKNNIWSVLNKLNLAAVTYYLLQERNDRIFRQENISEKELCSIIKDNIKYKLMSLGVKRYNVVMNVAEAWGLKWSNMWLKL
ncbi:RNA-directed DNA polymerase, eukaryota, reverse transcriptase zinc-binding domain protein [Tanacetum coccineum]